MIQKTNVTVGLGACALLIALGTSCASIVREVGQARDFWEGEDGAWATEVMIAALDAAKGDSSNGDGTPTSGNLSKQVEGVPFLSVQRVTASLDEGSESTGGMAPQRLTLHDQGQIQSFSLDPNNANHIIYSLFVFETDAKNGKRAPIGTQLWNIELDSGDGSPSKRSRLNLGGPNYRLNPVMADDGLIYFTTDEFGGLQMARMSMGGRQFQKLGLPGTALAGDIENNSILYSAPIESGGTEVRVVEASNRDQTVTICNGVQPRWSSRGEAIFFVDDGAIWRTTRDDHNTHDRVLSRPSPLRSEDVDVRFSLKDPSVSPDGTRIAYASNETQIGGRYNYEVFVARIDGADPQRITRLESHDDMPQWRSNDTIVFRSNRGRQWGLWEISVDAVEPPSSHE